MSDSIDQPAVSVVVPAAPEADYRAYVDSLVDGILYGWAAANVDSGAPTQIAIDVRIGDELVAQDVSADVMRLDLLDGGIGDGRFAFEVPLPLPLLVPAARIDVLVAGGGRHLVSLTVPDEAALGSPDPIADAAFAPVYRGKLETLTPLGVRGWAVRADRPDEIVSIDVMLDDVAFVTVDASGRRDDLRRAGLSGGAGEYKVRFPRGLTGEGERAVTVRFPDGSLLGQGTIPQTGQGVTALPAARATASPSVVIAVPIHNAFDDLTVCVERLVAHTTYPARLLLIDDASTDPRVARFLAGLARRDRIDVLTNEANLGFTATVNRALRESGTDDVVLLNSDARVTPLWLEGLVDAARADPHIGTVTPLSDRAGAFSAPEMGNANPLPAGVREEDFALAVRRRASGHYPTVPTANGFCVYLRRAMVDDVGGFDEAAFPRGYGEENDLSMRAGRRGWRHVIDDRTYVFHENARSFGGAKAGLVREARTVIDQRFPEYTKAIRTFSEGAGTLLARHNARVAVRDIAARPCPKPRALFVISTQTGGTPQTNRDLMEALGGVWDTWLLTCDANTVTLMSFSDGRESMVVAHELDEIVDCLTHRSSEYDHVVSGWLRSYGFRLVHVRHLGWHSLSLPALAKAEGAAVVNSFHDYYALCPTVKLLDERSVFCGGRCTSTIGQCTPELWPRTDFPPLKDGWVHQWRDRFAEALAVCDAFVTTSPSAHERISTHLGPLPPEDFAVIEHGRTFGKFRSIAHRPEPGVPIRILMPGNIDTSKGEALLWELLEHDTEARLEFHVMGTMSSRRRHPRLIHHGFYKRSEFAERAYATGAHVGAIFSIWDETYCHTLTELWSVGLPALVLDFATVAGRVRATGGGWVHDPRDTGALYQAIVRDLSDENGLEDRRRAVVRWQQGDGQFNTTRVMAARYSQLYTAVLANADAQRRTFAPPPGVPASPAVASRQPLVAVVCPADSCQTSAPASTHIRVWERTRNVPGRSIAYVRMSDVELMAGIRSGRIGAAILQRTAVTATMWPQLREAVRAGRLRFILDLDDDLTQVPVDKDPDRTYATYAPTLLEIIAHAQTVTVSTVALAERFRAAARDVTVLPNRLSRRLWAASPEPGATGGHRRVLYMGNATHDADFAMIRSALNGLARTVNGFRLRLVGGLATMPNPVPPWLEIVTVPEEARNYTKFVPWLKTVTQDVCLAVAPLEASTFNICKSPLKLMDYAALGLPVLASDHPVYAELAHQAPDVRTVRNQPYEWQRVLGELLGDPTLRERADRRMKDWVFSSHLLDESLDAYDSFVASRVLGAAAVTPG